MKIFHATLCALLCVGAAFSQAACGNRSKTDAQAGGANASSNNATTADDEPRETADKSSGVAGTESAEALALVEKGWEAYRSNRDEEAAAAFRQAVEIDPDFAEAHYKLGLAYDALQKDEEADKAYEEAVRAYRKFVESHEDDWDAHYHLGLALSKLRKHDEAVKAFRQATKLSPEDSDLFYELGLAHSKVAQYDEAVTALKKALDLNPDNYRAQEELERAQAGKVRRDAFLKQQERLQKQQAQKGQKNANANGNANVPPANTAAPAPTPSAP
ncbi:MAG TPA: tetratricopeptide repeat protein [Pyrinomonadaceae bacterium]|nr:tetratricopeptide repeat protein [Pyrinomonadaceae bacterium]